MLCPQTALARHYIILHANISFNPCHLFCACFLKWFPVCNFSSSLQYVSSFHLFSFTSLFYFCPHFIFSASLSSSPWTSEHYTVDASLVLYRHGKITTPCIVISNSFFFHSSDSQYRGLCCIIALVLSGQWLCSLVRLWCNLQNTRPSVVCSMGSEWAYRVIVLTSSTHSYSQRGVC